MASKISPRRLPVGPWFEGFALHAYMENSSFFGFQSSSQGSLDSARTPIGELLYRLKYKNDQTVVDELAETVAEFLAAFRSPIEGMIPVPPSIIRRIQPVAAVAREAARLAGIPLMESCVFKVKQTPQLVDTPEYDKRMQALAGVFGVMSEQSSGKNLLVFDDIFATGATARHVVNVLKTEGRARDVYLLTLVAE